MRNTVLLTAMLVLLGALPARAQSAAVLLAKESEIRASTPFAAMKKDKPRLTLQEYNAIVRGRARQELTKARAVDSAKVHFDKRSPARPTQETSFHFSPMKVEPFAIRSAREKTHSVLELHSENQLSGTDREIGSFSLNDLGSGTHCVKMREGVFIRTRCF
jgi:hypothetical protein